MQLKTILACYLLQIIQLNSTHLNHQRFDVVIPKIAQFLHKHFIISRWNTLNIEVQGLLKIWLNHQHVVDFFVNVVCVLEFDNYILGYFNGFSYGLDIEIFRYAWNAGDYSKRDNWFNSTFFLFLKDLKPAQ